MLSNILGGNIDWADTIIYILSSLAVIFLTLPVHEFAHGYTAVKLGDDTPRWQGRLTLNPFAHIDWLGSACILLFGFGWAKPVQVNARNFRNPKGGMAVVALAGPVSNIIVAFFSFVLINLISMIPANTEALAYAIFYIQYFLMYIASINVYLAVFNLVPIPPLDGSRLLTAILPDRYYYRIMQYERYIFLGLLVILYLGILDGPLDFLHGHIMNGVIEFSTLPFKLLNLK